jgi:hypothetical protein
MKINSIVNKSNNFKYARVLINNNIVLSTRSDIKISNHNKVTEQKNLVGALDLYNSNRIKYSTFLYIQKKFSKLYSNNKSVLSFLTVLTELSWESGLVLNRELIFTKK